MSLRAAPTWLALLGVLGACNLILGNESTNMTVGGGAGDGGSSGTTSSSAGGTSSGAPPPGLPLEPDASSPDGGGPAQCTCGVSSAGFCLPCALGQATPGPIEGTVVSIAATDQELWLSTGATLYRAPLGTAGLPGDAEVVGEVAYSQLTTELPSSGVVFGQAGTHVDRCELTAGTFRCEPDSDDTVEVAVQASGGLLVMHRAANNESGWLQFRASGGALTDLLAPLLDSDDHARIVVAANRTRAFVYAPSGEALQTAVYAGAPAAVPSSLLAQQPVALAANDETLFSAPCNAARAAVCARSLGSLPAPSISSLDELEVTDLYVDGSHLFFNAGAQAYHCNAYACEPEPIGQGNPIRSFTRNEQFVYVQVQDVTYWAPRTGIGQ